MKSSFSFHFNDWMVEDSFLFYECSKWSFYYTSILSYKTLVDFLNGENFWIMVRFCVGETDIASFFVSFYFFFLLSTEAPGDDRKVLNFFHAKLLFDSSSINLLADSRVFQQYHE